MSYAGRYSTPQATAPLARATPAMYVTTYLAAQCIGYLVYSLLPMLAGIAPPGLPPPTL